MKITFFTDVQKQCWYMNVSILFGSVHSTTNFFFRFFVFLISNRLFGGFCKIVNSSFQKVRVKMIRMQGKRVKWSMVAMIQYSGHVLWIYIFGEYIGIFLGLALRSGDCLNTHQAFICFGHDRIRVKIIYYYIFVLCLSFSVYFWWFHFRRFNFVVDSVHTNEIAAQQQ